MIHGVCDFCGYDVDRFAILVTMTPFSNFARYHNDIKPFGSENESKSFVMCNKCREKHNLPNPYNDYKQITNQSMKYEKCLDNYTDDDRKKDLIEKKEGLV